jgi:ORF6N domain
MGLEPIAIPAIEKRILLLRDRQVMLDEGIADLYGVETRALVQQVRRNAKRFPADFMFQLSAEEFTHLKSQSVISSGEHGRRRTRPLAFTDRAASAIKATGGIPAPRRAGLSQISSSVFSLSTERGSSVVTSEPG